MESSTLGMVVLSMIALFGTAAFCFEHLATRSEKKKKGSSRNPGKHRNKNADLMDDVRASKHI